MWHLHQNRMHTVVSHIMHAARGEYGRLEMMLMHCTLGAAALSAISLLDVHPGAFSTPSVSATKYSERKAPDLLLRAARTP